MEVKVKLPSLLSKFLWERVSSLWALSPSDLLSHSSWAQVSQWPAHCGPGSPSHLCREGAAGCIGLGGRICVEWPAKLTLPVPRSDSACLHLTMVSLRWASVTIQFFCFGEVSCKVSFLHAEALNKSWLQLLPFGRGGKHVFWNWLAGGRCWAPTAASSLPISLRCPHLFLLPIL